MTFKCNEGNAKWSFWKYTHFSLKATASLIRADCSNFNFKVPLKRDLWRLFTPTHQAFSQSFQDFEGLFFVVIVTYVLFCGTFFRKFFFFRKKVVLQKSHFKYFSLKKNQKTFTFPLKTCLLTVHKEVKTPSVLLMGRNHNCIPDAVGIVEFAIIVATQKLWFPRFTDFLTIVAGIDLPPTASQPFTYIRTQRISA